MRHPGFFTVEIAVAGGAGGPNGAYLSLRPGDVVRVVGDLPTRGYVLGSSWGSLSWPRAATSNQGLMPTSALRPALQSEVAPLSFIQPPGSNIPFQGRVGLPPMTGAWTAAAAPAMSPYVPPPRSVSRHWPSSNHPQQHHPTNRGRSGGGHPSATAFRAGMLPPMPEATTVQVPVEADPPLLLQGAATGGSATAPPPALLIDIPDPPTALAAPLVAAPLPPPTPDASSADALIAEAVADAVSTADKSGFTATDLSQVSEYFKAHFPPSKKHPTLRDLKEEAKSSAEVFGFVIRVDGQSLVCTRAGDYKDKVGPKRKRSTSPWLKVGCNFRIGFGYVVSTWTELATGRKMYTKADREASGNPAHLEVKRPSWRHAGPS